MGFYELPKDERATLVAKIKDDILKDLANSTHLKTLQYFSDEDTYIRKSVYLAIGKIFFEQTGLQNKIIQLLDTLFKDEDFKVRQTVINTAGEIGKKQFETVQFLFDKGLFDNHHSPRNAVIGSIKKMGEINPTPVLNWAKTYLCHQDKEIRREICHGLELRGRKHPEDILPLLQELQHDKTKRVRDTLVHVIGQISYKKNCLQKVISHLKTWENKALIADALEEIIDVHHRYRDFAVMTQDQARQYIENNYSIE
ncbi:HEAT domain containing protein [Pseudopedobacter saltans DSM 12145]|uniref:HEAT domain containing protein n=1 Tax=Pseudopedobacter saltans (strain ATCC 51119 / DSM 12145 / JCM 21818 / CCUG 39354 / LMG 10337 / NBRC 100064 / NCIMB 13643) TaxID=762903 RepID=F0SCZ7_PSESL|nr:HEAT repeat domain-containing protein [Pseudopedobacter saltans]ADY51754.1 HEAT domain containing protein [Pseudopedobacter saltans DSM 12145]